MDGVENILKEDEFSVDTADTPKEDVEQWECFKGAIKKGKVYLLGGKKRWAHKRVNETRQKTINKTFAEYKQHA